LKRRALIGRELKIKKPSFYNTIEKREFSRGLRRLRGKLKNKMNLGMNVTKINGAP
jgi:hypothetical protein